MKLIVFSVTYKDTTIRTTLYQTTERTLEDTQARYEVEHAIACHRAEQLSD